MPALPSTSPEDPLLTLPPTAAPQADTGPSSASSAAPPASASEEARFHILRAHARGGLGQVSVALDVPLQREVAVKEILSQHADDDASRTRFLREAEITGGLEHPGIVPVYALGQHADGRPFYAMRFIKGDSLHDALKRFHEAGPRSPGERALELRQLLRRFLDVCNAVAYAHSRGVLHRDLKPRNIMLGSFGETLVVDWGLAKRLQIEQKEPEAVPESASTPQSSETQAGMVVGTPGYLSPEQAEGRTDLTLASDIYSLGATLYCLLSGRGPFQGEDVAVILKRVRQGDFLPPRRVRREVSPVLEAVCLKAMALKPEDRYASAKDLADDIEHWLADEPAKAYRESRLQRFARWGRRHRTAVATATVALLLTVLAAAGGLMLWARAEEEQQRQAREHNTRLRGNSEMDSSLALADIRSGRFESARSLLKEAIARLEDLDDAEDLKAALEMRLGRAVQLIEFHKFADDAQNEEMLERDRQSIAFAEKALDKVNVFQHEDWWKHLPTDDLLPEESKRFEFEVQRQLILLGLVHAKQGLKRFGQPASKPSFRAALRALAASQRYAPTLTASVVEIFCHTGLGEAPPNKAPGPKEPQGATDYYCLGLLHHWLANFPGHAASRAARLYLPLLGIKAVDLDNPRAKAPEYFRAAAALDPRHIWTYLWLGESLWNSNNLDAAESAYLTCMGVRPDRAGGYLALGRCLAARAYWAKDAKVKADFYARALRAVNDGIRIEPNNPKGYGDRYWVNEKMGNEKELLADLDTIVRLIPEDPSAYRVRAVHYQTRADYTRALKDYERALRLDPNDIDLLIDRAQVWSLQGDDKRAQADLAEALRRDPKQPDALHERGELHAERGRHALAVADFTAAIESNSRNAASFIERARSFLALGRFEDVEKDCTQALALNAKKAEAHNLRAIAHERRGDYVRAIADFDAAIRVDPASAVYLVNRAHSRWRLGEQGQAVADCGAALKLVPYYAHAFNIRALAHTMQPDYARALKDFAEAMRLQPRSAIYLGNRAYCHTRHQAFAEAIADCDAALKLDAKHARAHFFRAHALFGQGEREKALADFGRAIALSPDAPDHYRGRAAVHIAGQAWGQAVEDLARATACKQFDPEAWHEQALLSLRSSDLDGFRKALGVLLGRAEQKEDPLAARWAVRTGVLRPDPEMVPRLLAQAELLAARYPRDPAILRLHGAALVRAGRFEAGSERLAEALKAPAESEAAKGFLAVAHLKRGQAEDARRWLNGASQALKQPPKVHPPAFPASAWKDHLEMQLLREEITRALP